VSFSRRVLLQLTGAHALAPAIRSLGRGLVSIVTLHRFADPRHATAGHDPAALRDHLAYLRRHRYRLLGLTDVLDLLERGVNDSATPAVVFTVDDGYSDFAHIGAPIFAEYDCPVTLFVTTGFLDGAVWLWWDRVAWLLGQTSRSSVTVELASDVFQYSWSSPEERAQVQYHMIHRLELIDGPARDFAIATLARQCDVALPERAPPEFAPMTWDELRHTADLGVTFGPHTVTHRILSLATQEGCEWEIRESWRRLGQETTAVVPVFAYPNGGARAFGARERDAVQRAGLHAAVTTVPGHAVPQSAAGAHIRAGRFALPRFPYPDDRPHVVHIAAGLGRFTHPLQRARLPT